MGNFMYVEELKAELDRVRKQYFKATDVFRKGRLFAKIQDLVKAVSDAEGVALRRD